jgi:hypothetical protein
MMGMAREQIESALAAALYADGLYPFPYGWPRDKMASVAFRRWHSFARRSKSKHPTDGERVLDLAKGLQEHFDPVHHDCSLDFLHYAKIMAPILKGDGIDDSPIPSHRGF